MRRLALVLAVGGLLIGAFALGRQSGIQDDAQDGTVESPAPTGEVSVTSPSISNPEAQRFALLACQAEEDPPLSSGSSAEVGVGEQEAMRATLESLRESAVLAEEAASLDGTWSDFAEAYLLAYESYQGVLNSVLNPEPLDPDDLPSLDAPPWTVASGSLVRDVLNETCRGLGVVRIEDRPGNDF